jgi:hypothetical protein
MLRIGQLETKHALFYSVWKLQCPWKAGPAINQNEGKKSCLPIEAIDQGRQLAPASWPISVLARGAAFSTGPVGQSVGK